jgi:hypothetical protein
MRLYSVMDGSGLGCSQLQFWHTMPWGRPPQQSRNFASHLNRLSAMKKTI